MPGNRKHNKSKKGTEHQITNPPPNLDDYIVTRARSQDKTSKSPTTDMSTRAAAMMDIESEDMSTMRAFIRDSLKEQTNEIVGKIDSMNNEIKELTKKTADILDSVEYNSVQIRKNADDFAKLREELEGVKTEYEQRLLTQELYTRKSNLLVYGIADEREPDAAVRETFDKMGLSGVEEMLFASVHRLPRTSTDPTNFRADMPKPIMVKFVQSHDRQRVYSASFKNGDYLRTNKISIRTDLPVPLKKVRGKLANKAFHLRKTKKMQTRIMEKGIDITLEIRKNAQDKWRTIGLNEDV